MKKSLNGILQILQSLEDRYQIRTEGEIEFKQAKNELQRLIDIPEPEKKPEPVAVVVPAQEVDNFKQLVMDKLDGFEDVLALILHSMPALSDVPTVEEPPAQTEPPAATEPEPEKAAV